jgi:hypothetical protein
MAHISDWHAFDIHDFDTYPSVRNAPIQVRYADNRLAEGNCLLLVDKRRADVVAWRYIRDPQIS